MKAHSKQTLGTGGYDLWNYECLRFKMAYNRVTARQFMRQFLSE